MYLVADTAVVMVPPAATTVLRATATLLLVSRIIQEQSARGVPAGTPLYNRLGVENMLMTGAWVSVHP